MKNIAYSRLIILFFSFLTDSFHEEFLNQPVYTHTRDTRVHAREAR